MVVVTRSRRRTRRKLGQNPALLEEGLAENILKRPVVELNLRDSKHKELKILEKDNGYPADDTALLQSCIDEVMESGGMHLPYWRTQLAEVES